MMLSRIANNAFWTGRYFERAEHISRFCKVQAISSVDAPIAIDKDAALVSILNFIGITEAYFKKYPALTNHEFFQFVGYEPNNPFSIKNIIFYARENTRSMRNLIPSEVWEATNKFYHSLDDFRDADRVYDFYQHIIDNIYIVKGVINNTLIRDELYCLFNIGMYLERALQVIRILLAKLYDVEAMPLDKLGSPLENYHWTNLLRSAGGFDMGRKIYKSTFRRNNAIEMILLNRDFPKSVLYSLMLLNRNFARFGVSRDNKSNPSAGYLAEKIEASLRYLRIEDIAGKEVKFLQSLLEDINKISVSFEKTYLSLPERQIIVEESQSQRQEQR
jgi:uncharacterized alpha-E superfamily protein